MKYEERILLTGRDEKGMDLLDLMLKNSGFQVCQAGDGKTMWQLLSAETFDLIVLDGTLPGEDGLALLKQLTMGETSPGLPVILLTGQEEATDRIVGLELGADDSLSKPFHPRELLARIRSVLRRSRQATPGKPQKSAASCRFADWTLQVNSQSLVAPDGAEIMLSRGEFNLLMLFLKHPGEIIDRDRIMDVHRGRDLDLDERSVDVLVARLRKRLREQNRAYRLLRTVWGRGYQFCGDVTWS